MTDQPIPVIPELIISRVTWFRQSDVDAAVVEMKTRRGRPTKEEA